jgi:hypothetical protein
MVLADLTRHRMLSWSVESTRARPTESLIEQVEQNPYIPTFLERSKGMQGGPPLRGAARTRATSRWLIARDHALEAARGLLGTSKQHVGRLLEPWLYVTAIISGTDWQNFFVLRGHPLMGAQPEAQRIAQMMEEAYLDSRPRMLGLGEWHLPLVTEHERAVLSSPDALEPAYVSAGRCASVSYLKHTRQEDNLASAERWTERLQPFSHWSPSEHPAQCVEDGVSYMGNFRGFKQLRKFYPFESAAVAVDDR